MSDDGRHGLTLIAFIGSVFSPYYALARRRGAAEPCEHVALNVALYGPGARRWTMTERAAPALARGPGMLKIGPSGLTWDGASLTADIEEISAPIPRRVVGQVRLTPLTLNSRCFAIDGHGAHLWRPIAPLADVSIAFDKPAISWSGRGYFDWNSGTAPLERDFRSWTWSRSSESDRARICYDVVRADNARGTLDVEFNQDGTMATRECLELRDLLPSPVWRIARSTRCEATSDAVIQQTLEDTPFYARSVIRTVVDGRTAPAVHESLDLDRFRRTIVQLMLPFRMPRRAR